MPELLDHISFLSQEVGPRPAGTEEEQQAALYITECFQKDADLSAVIEDFNSESSDETPKALCAFLTVVITILAIFFPILVIPSIIVTIITAILFVLEVFDKSFILRRLSRGVSQNVVAKYEPGYSAEAGGSRRRKIVLLAHYDSGKVRGELKQPILGIVPTLHRLAFYAMVFVPVFLMTKAFFFLHADGILGIILNIITGAALLLASFPLLLSLSHRFSSYNESANCNASGVAVLLEVAKRIGRGRVSSPEALDRAATASAIYGEESARAAGLVPEGAQLVYEAGQLQAPSQVPQSEGERLASAKAAIEAITGRPVANKEETSVASNLVQARDEYKTPAGAGAPGLADIGTQVAQAAGGIEQVAQAAGVGAAGAAGVAGAAAGVAAGAAAVGAANVQGSGGSGSGQNSLQAAGGLQASEASDVPDWFKKAQENAKRPKKAPVNVQRSRYADALDAAVAESASHFNQANKAVNTETEDRLRQAQQEIREAGVPQPAVEQEAEYEQYSYDEYADGNYEAEENLGYEQYEEEVIEQPDHLEAHNPEEENRLRGEGQPDSTQYIDPIPVEDIRAQQQAQPAQSVSQKNAASNSSNFPSAQASIAGVIPALTVPDLGAPSSSLPASSGVAREKRPVTLPDISLSGSLPLSKISGGQRPSILPREESAQSASQSFLNNLPSTMPTEETPSAGTTAEAFAQIQQQAQARSGLHNMLPSLSGEISRNRFQDLPSLSGEISRTAFQDLPSLSGSLSHTSYQEEEFLPAEDHSYNNYDSYYEEDQGAGGFQEMYVQDVDDSDHAESYSDSGDFSGNDYMDMPQSRVKKLFGKLGFGKNKKKEATHDGWGGEEEHYQEEPYQEGHYQEEYYQEEPYHEEPQEASNDGWNDRFYDATEDQEWRGGAFSRERVSYDEDDLDTGAGYGSYGDSRGLRNSRSLRNSSSFGDSLSFGQPERQDSQQFASGELRQIQQFRHPGLDTEIWFVALGSELSGCGGMNAFITEHAQDLRGAMFINLRALGAGELCYVEKEGLSQVHNISSRMKRYVQKAAQASGVSVGGASILWSNSATTVAAKKGMQALSLVGMDGAKPAFYAQGDDVLENVDEETLRQNTEFVMELLKNI